MKDRPRLGRRLGGAALALLASLACAPSAWADVNAAVGGVRDPAAGVLELWVQASEDDGIGLRTTRAILGGQTLSVGHFADPACGGSDPQTRCPLVGVASLTVPTTAVADGVRRLEVTVEDGAGAVVTVLDLAITVDNASRRSTSTVTLRIGSDDLPSPPGSPPGTAPRQPGAASRAGCQSPQLSASLAQRPLRLRDNVPVLAARRTYRFTGRLTCRVDRRRRSAPRGTKVELRQIVRGRTVDKETLRVRDSGKILTRFAFRRSSTLSFRLRGAEGELVQVRIPIRVASVKRGRR